MAAGMTKTALVRHLAEKLELNNKTAAAFLATLAEVAVKGNEEEWRIRSGRPGPLEKVAAQGSHGPQSANRRSPLKFPPRPS